jgi:hypothetical protein
MEDWNTLLFLKIKEKELKGCLNVLMEQNVVNFRIMTRIILEIKCSCEMRFQRKEILDAHLTVSTY